MKQTQNVHNLAIFIVPIIALVLGAFAPTALAGGYHWQGDTLELEEAHLYFELNDTDGDLGIHGKIDGGPWKYVRIKDPYRHTIMAVSTYGRLKRQGLTELFFESAEPTFDELDPEKFFKRFPEGIYKIYGRTQKGQLLWGESEIRHVMPAQPGLQADGETIIIILQGDGDPIEDQVIKEACDDEDPAFSPAVVSGDTVTISWDAVDSSHPTIGKVGDIEVAFYQVVVEAEIEVNGDEFTAIFSADLPPDVTEMTVPAEFLSLSDEFKYEILVREAAGGNQTAVESCFIVEE
jgi:hypothetical protein